MNNWILLTIIYALFVSLSEVAKKKATKINSIYEVLPYFTTISLIITIFTARDIFDINFNYLPLVMLKVAVVVIAWILGFKAISVMQLGLYGMIKISRLLFSVLLSYLLLGEKITFISMIGMAIIILGLVLVNTTTNKGEDKKASLKIILLFLFSCFCSSLSSIIDKKVLVHITTGQLQFWYLLFLSSSYWIILFIKNRSISFKKVKTNYWILLISICLVIGERFLFMATENPDSKVIIITMLKQMSAIISIILGKYIFNEKDTLKKLLYSVLIIVGVIIMILF